MRVVDPLTPQRGHVIELQTEFGRVVETLTLTPTFTFQLRAFAPQSPAATQCQPTPLTA